MTYQRPAGFTLVELAIVMTIIGLLIGGVLKGQELLENARMTSAAAQLKSFSAATTTFKDVYKAWPGDIANPGNLIEGCTASPCNVSGNADGEIGPVYTSSGGPWYNDENNNYWVHLALARLISGIDPTVTWTAAARFHRGLPSNKMGGQIAVWTSRHHEAPYTNGVNGRFFLFYQATADQAGVVGALPVNRLAKYDLKVDDGKPWSGDVLLDSSGCGISTGTNVYDPNVMTVCTLDVAAGF